MTTMGIEEDVQGQGEGRLRHSPPSLDDFPPGLVSDEHERNFPTFHPFNVAHALACIILQSSPDCSSFSSHVLQLSVHVHLHNSSLASLFATVRFARKKTSHTRPSLVSLSTHQFEGHLQQTG